MKRIFRVALMFGGCLTAASLIVAQTTPDKSKPAAAGQSSANPFPEDTSSVPVMGTKSAPEVPTETHDGAANPGIPLPGEDVDPARSPDDQPTTSAASEQTGESSSSLTGLEKLLPVPEDDSTQKKKKLAAVKEPTHQEAASKDVEIGGYYLERKNWKGALSRFESALVLDPENPDVYWGLAEAEQHLGRLADARTHFEKVAEYDPDSKHGKEARKALKEPEIANGKNAGDPVAMPDAVAK